MFTYHPRSELTLTEITAGHESGTLTPWRRGANGELWYRRAADIHAVPADIDPSDCEIIAADDEGGTGLDDEAERAEARRHFEGVAAIEYLESEDV